MPPPPPENFENLGTLPCTQDSMMNKITSCGYNDAWFVTLRSKVTTALEETNEETISNHNMGANHT